MRKLIIVLFCLISLVTKAQVYQEMPQYGYRANRMAFDSTLQIPTTCGVPTLRSNVTKKAAIAFDSCNNKIYRYNPKTLTWSEIAGGSGSTPNLQQVTDVNDSTTNSIYLNYDTIGWNNLISLLPASDSGIKPKIEVASLNGLTKIEPEYIYLNNASTNQLQLSSSGVNFNDATNYNVITPILNGLHFFRLYQADTSKHNDTLATLQDIRSGGTTIDTTNKWVNSVTKVNDSTLNIIKGTSNSNLTITGVSYAKKLKTQVWNNTGDTINKGSVVYISGRHSSNLPTIALAEANSEANSYKTFAIVENDILDNSEGTVIQAGNISGLSLPTSSYTDGDIVYLSPTVPGGLTITKPLAPYHICKIGSVTRAHPTQGSIEVKIENGWQLDELSDVQIPAVPNDSTLLQFSRVDSLWHSVSVTNAIGTKYLKPTDTASLSSRINLKVNISDTATMLSPYERTINNDFELLEAYQLLGSSIKSVSLSCISLTNLTTSGALTNQQIRFFAVYLPKAQTITGVKWMQLTAGNYTANNYNGLGLYSYSGGTLTLVASSTNDGNIWKVSSTNTFQSKAFSSTYAAAAGVYYVGALYCSSAQTTAPGIYAAITGNATYDFTSVISATLNTQTALPSSQASNGLSVSTGNLGFWVY